jgi:hypothetical protein
MKNLYLINLLLLFINSCTYDIPVNSSPVEEGSVVILNSSFEKGKSASFEGWQSAGPPKVKLVNIAPPAGGNYSVLVKAQELGAYVSKIINLEPGDNELKFSLWGKTEGQTGNALVYHKKNDELILLMSLSIRSSSWKYYSSNTIITAEEGDELKIILSGTETITPTAVSWFDLCKIEKLNK